MSIEIINDALKYYDSNNRLYDSIRKKIRYFEHDSVDKRDVEGVRFIFYDKDMNKLFTSRVEIFGKFYNSINTWVWGWSLPGINKSLTSLIRKVFLYGTDIDINDNSANIMLRNELVTSRFRIEDNVQLDIHCAIASYLAKKPFVFALTTLNVSFDELAEIDVLDNLDLNAKTDSVAYYVYIIDPPNV